MQVKRDIFTKITCELYGFNAWLDDQTGQTGLEPGQERSELQYGLN